MSQAHRALSSNDGAAAAPGPSPAPTPSLELQKLHSLPSEQQDLQLLVFTADLVRHVDGLDPDNVSVQQAAVKRELLQILHLSSPAPTRAIRHNLARAFAVVFAKGNRRILFETANELLGLLNDGKAEADLVRKHAAVHCLGEMYYVAGDSIASISAEIATAVLRLLRSAQNHVGLRAAIMVAVRKIFHRMGSSADESLAREAWKQAKNLASADKAVVVRRDAVRCLEQLVGSTAFFDNQTDLDTLKALLFRALDTPARVLRHAAAACLSAALVKAYTDDDALRSDAKRAKAKKPNRRQSLPPEEEQEQVRQDGPAPKKSTAKLYLGLADILRQLATHYTRPSTSNRARAGLALCYAKVLSGLGPAVVQAHYATVADHLLVELLTHPTVTAHRYRLLISRRFVRVILDLVLGQNMLTEAGQLQAVRFLVNDVLKNYPQVIKDRAEPSKHSLTGALGSLASLLRSLGSAVSTVADACRDGLMQVLQHLSYTVQVATAHCLREFVRACPQQLLPCLSICMNSLGRELGLLTTPRQSPRKCVGYANGLAAVLSVSPDQPLYGSIEVDARILALATGLLKSSTDSELRTSATQIQVAWILIGGLMSLGPNFVKMHLSQLLLMWRNALPKSLSAEQMAQRTALELSFLAHVRECALGSVLAFLEYNHRLLTSDVSRRLAAMLQHTTAFLDSLPARKTSDDMSQRLSPSLQLDDLDRMVRRRVLQCYTDLVRLSPAGGSDTLLHANLVTLAMSFFADPDNYAPSSLSSTIASSTASFENVWDIGDNSGFGVTGLVCGLDLKRLAAADVDAAAAAAAAPSAHWLTRRGPDAIIDQTLLTPIAGAREHDSVSLYLARSTVVEELPDPPATEVVNSAIALFAIAFPMQPAKVQESILEQMATFLSAHGLQRDPGRRAAMTVNVALAILATLQTGSRQAAAAAGPDGGDARGAAVDKITLELLRGFVLHADQYVRNIGCAALGHLCSRAGNGFTNQEVKALVEVIVSNRDPHARAGCAVALGCIHAQVGGMAAGYHLKNIFGVLISLIKDPHPTVHFWALEGLIRMIDSAGLTFSPLVSSSLGMLAQIYVADSHNEETALLVSSNLETDWPTVAAIARCTDSLVNVLGPDLQDMGKARDLIATLVSQLQSEEDSRVVLESLRCREHLTLYAPAHVDLRDYVRRLQAQLGAVDVDLRDAAVDGLYSLMKREPERVLAAAEPGLEEQLWLVLDAVPSHDGIRNIVRNWLQRTSLSQTGRWIVRCRDVMKKVKATEKASTTTSQVKSSGVPDLQDEEVAGFASSAAASKEEAADAVEAGQEPLRWQVQSFAMSCLSDLLAAVGRQMLAGAEVAAAESALQHSVAEVIRIAFSASTSNVVELRVLGLRVIDQVLNMFGKTPDPDFAEASLLEQYQAQISSALTPAFTADSSPELASEAVNVCASFIATGIVTDVDRMGRILKLLVAALESFSGEGPTSAIGELKGLSSNAQVMVRMAVFAAWAELQVASVQQGYLSKVMTPYIGRLTPLWLSSLKEFARLRFEPDISVTMGPPSAGDDLDTVYAALNRETLLKFYQDRWLKLVDAIASLIEQDSGFVFEALDGKAEPATPNGTVKATDINYRDEPLAFFFVLYGIVFEALVGRSGGDLLASGEQMVEVLVALKKILHPSVSGQAIYQDVVFSETMELLDRLVLTEGLDVQRVIVDMVRDLCLAHPSARERHEASEASEHLSEDIDQLFELTRLVVLVLSGLLPTLTGSKAGPPGGRQKALSSEAMGLVQGSLEALVDVAEVFPRIIKSDLYACIMHIFATMLGTGSCQAEIVPRALPVFKRFVQGIGGRSLDGATEGSVTVHLRGCLQRFLAILKRAQRREEEWSVACEKNALLACTILVTGGIEMLSAEDGLVLAFLDELVDCVEDRMTGQVAGNCIRSIMLAPGKSGPGEAMAQRLFPRLLSFLTTAAASELDGVRSAVGRTLTSASVTARSAEQAGASFSLVMPALLRRAAVDGEGVYGETAARLLELAGHDQGLFRRVASGMGSETRALMERVLREGARPEGPDGERAMRQAGREPSIALKMTFGESST